MGWPRRAAPFGQGQIHRWPAAPTNGSAGELARTSAAKASPTSRRSSGEQLQELQQLFAGAGQMLGYQLVALVGGDDARAAAVSLIFLAAHQATLEQPIAQPGDRGRGDAQGLCQRTWQLRTVVIEQMQQSELRHTQVEAQPGGQGGGAQPVKVGFVQVDEGVQP